MALTQLEKDVRNTRERVIRIESNVDYIKKSISKLPCQIYKEDLEKLSKKVNKLENYKNQAWGIILGVSAVFSFAFKFIWEFIKNKIGG